MNSYLVSIIVPCYNQAQYLDEALQSVLDQTYKNWECIIVNDGSSDNTSEVAQRWVEKDCRFQYIYQENGGVSSARNLGILNARGKFVLPLDADDKIGLSYIEKGVEAFENNSNLKVVYCKAVKFGKERGSWNLPFFSLQKLTIDNIIFCSALYKKEDWQRIGGYDVTMFLGLEDWEFWIALLKNGGEVECLNEVGFYYRIKEKSRQLDITQNYKKELKEYIIKKHPDFYLKNHLELYKKNHELEENLRSEKVLINELCFQLFGIRIFKLKS